MSFIDGITNADALPVLESAMKFAAQRHRTIVNNIANFSTPNFQPQDVSVPVFQKVLSEAIDNRREQFGGQRGELRFRETQEIRTNPDGSFKAIRPGPMGGNVMFHDRNNRDLEHTMQDLVENVAAFRISGELLGSRHDLINAAIRERS